MMRLSDLQTKYIVNVQDGKNIGNIIDAKINENTGEIESLVIDPNKNFFSFTKGKIDTEINWKCIEKIGEDVILVNISL
ncbi:MAG: YlmC/YmxH family sporulation protein [Bacilli bacterium]|nr:YlmC/YmxH family sporulation protein [Bacilli bacterium]